MVMSPPDEEEKMEVESKEQTVHEWLLKDMPSLPMFDHILEQVCEALRQVRLCVALCIVIKEVQSVEAET
jgi:hypothetical protein